MTYETEKIASTLRTARMSKALSQRELSAKAGVPQGHISKIENGAVDLRVSSLVALARALDLELTLVPRKAVSAVQSIARSSTHSTIEDGKAVRKAQRELARFQETLASLPKTVSFSTEVAKLQRQVRELQRFRLGTLDVEALGTFSRAVKAFRNETKSLDAIRQASSALQNMTNALAHSSTSMPHIESVRPAYSLDENNDG